VNRAALNLIVVPLLAATSIAGPAEFLDATGGQLGPFVVHLNCGEGAETVKLLERDGLVVQGLDTDRAKIDAARKYASRRGDYGKRITFSWFDGKHLPFIDNSVNTIVVSDVGCQVSGGEIARALAPRGVLLTRTGPGSENPPGGPRSRRERATCSPVAPQLRLIDSAHPLPDGWFAYRNPVPSDIDEWTHHMHGPDNNRVANDSRIKPRLSHLQWTVGPRYTRHHEHMSSFSAMVSSGGRIFYVVDEGLVDTVLLPSDWNLIARDAFNGIELWRIKIDKWFDRIWTFKSGPVVVTRRLVADGDRLYAAMEMGGRVSVIDANTGGIICEVPGTERGEEILVDGDRLIVVKRDWLSRGRFLGDARSRHKLNGSAWDKAGGKQSVAVFDKNSRNLLWEKEMPVAPMGIGSKNGKVYVFDGEFVYSFAMNSGKESWKSEKIARKDLYTPNNASSLVCGDNRILVGSLAKSDCDMVALSAEDGSVVWRNRQHDSGRHSANDLFLIDGKAWSVATMAASMTLPGVPSTAKLKSGRTVGYDVETGKIEQEFFTESDVYMMNARCHMSCATTNFLIPSRTGVELVSLKDEKWTLHHWVRGSCLYGLMPANGILYAPPNPCGCYSQSNLDHFNAVTGENPSWERTLESLKSADFVSGVKMKKESVKPEPDVWPTYRHDNLRSAGTRTEVKLPLKRSWRVDGYENLTAPVVAQNRIFLAEKDKHILHALGAENGANLWSYVAGGRIDSPPTACGNALFFGSADGWLYKLRVADGALVWKRRIGPADLSLFNYGQPTSVWPLMGNVLVQDGKVYAVAGRSMFLDGGLRFVALDAETGDVVHENVMNELDPNTGEDMHVHVAMQNMPVALPDILSSDGAHIYMRSQQFDLTGKRTHISNSAWDESIEIAVGREHVFSPTGFLDDNWYHRSYWVYGNGFMEGCGMPDGGWFEMSRISPAGKMLCFDEENVYGYGQAFPEYSRWSTALRFQMFSMNKKPKRYTPGVPDAKLRGQKPSWRKFRSLRRPKVEFDFNWKEPLPVRAKALIKTANKLFLAGPEDVLDEEAFFANPRDERNRVLADRQDRLIRSRTGGKLAAISADGGHVMQQVDLASQPVWDGMAAAYGKLFMCCRDGSVVAFGTGEPGNIQKQ